MASVVLNCIELRGPFHCECMSSKLFSTVLLLWGFPQQASVFEISPIMYFKWNLIFSEPC